MKITIHGAPGGTRTGVMPYLDAKGNPPSAFVAWKDDASSMKQLDPDNVAGAYVRRGKTADYDFVEDHPLADRTRAALVEMKRNAEGDI